LTSCDGWNSQKLIKLHKIWGLQAGQWLKSVGLVQRLKGWQPSGTVLHSSREPGELMH